MEVAFLPFSDVYVTDFELGFTDDESASAETAGLLKSFCFNPTVVVVARTVIGVK